MHYTCKLITILVVFVTFLSSTSTAFASSPPPPPPLSYEYVWVNKNTLPKEVAVTYDLPNRTVGFVNNSKEPLYFLNTNAGKWAIDRWEDKEMLKKFPENSLPSMVIIEDRVSYYDNNQLHDLGGEGLPFSASTFTPEDKIRSIPSVLFYIPQPFSFVVYLGAEPVTIQGWIFFLPNIKNPLSFLFLIPTIIFITLCVWLWRKRSLKSGKV